jgi:hypothetical protein
MHDPFNDLAGLIAEEEKAQVANVIATRVGTIQAQPDGPIRARIFAACALIGGAELMSELEGPEAAAKQLRKLADRLEAGAGPLQ